MSRRVYSTTAALAVLALMSIACDRGDTLANPDGTTTTTAARSDDQLATYVQARYQSDPSIAASDIDVTARNGAVTLRGTVSSDTAREQAATLARQVEGVQSVDNQLQVTPRANSDAIASGRPVEPGATATGDRTAADLSRSPAWITTKIQAQFFADTDVKPWNIDVTTRSDGTVTLQGEVDDAASREAAERIARSTEGVTTVNNQLRLRAEGDRTAATGTPQQPREERAGDADGDDQPDGWVTAKIQAKYFMDPDVKGLQINVDTRDGVVTLTGNVEDSAARRQAVALARNTDGVRSVNDQLQVSATAADRTTAPDRDATARRGSDQPLEDAWITTKVQSQFFLDADIKGRDINVDTRNGVVTLKGEVESETEKQMAQTIAQETEGVTRVVNNLAIAARERQ